MKFELDDTLIDDILFHMENQDGDFLFDMQELEIVSTDFYDLFDKPDFSDDERFIGLPDWTPADGYRLMEKFTAKLKNPVARSELSAALNKNKGVFRKFRDVLEQYPEIKKMWFSYKEQKMKNEVIAWYNALREEWGLKPIGSEPEDTTSLVMEDFVIRKGNNDFVFLAETGNGDSAGCISAELNDKVLHINSLEVNPEYRGIGLGKTLLAKLLESAENHKLDVTLDLPAETDFFSRSLLLENFKPCMQRFIRRKNP
jgi:ribosomal protein S18 acetylase RimI-like enzyme